MSDHVSVMVEIVDGALLARVATVAAICLALLRHEWLGQNNAGQ